ncbi:MAG: T9SS type A sorting domain-containing protein [Ignavibacteria bacterium]|nr:T9SS type A sorting domain-containing protein [Ignavibacteria bacterium]
MNQIKNILLILLIFTASVSAQRDLTPDSKLNQSSFRKVSGNENEQPVVNGKSSVPVELLDLYNQAVDTRNSSQKKMLTEQIESYLQKSVFTANVVDMEINKYASPPFITDWYGTDVQVTNSDVKSSGNYRQMDLKQGEDGWMYMAVNRRNVTGLNGCITVYSSSNGGAVWNTVTSLTSVSGYYGAVSMLVESRNNNVPDSTRILVYATLSSNSSMDDAYLICSSFRRDGSAAGFFNVANPSAGNRFVFPSACSDGIFWDSQTYMHAVVREETNAGVYVKLHHFRSTTWGVSHTSVSLNATFDDRYPVSAFSNESGADSIYIAVERVVANDEHEIRLFATPEIPTASWSLRYITDAAPGTIYERPSIAIQQRYFSLPQRILVTCTKNDRAVYHYSNDGGAAWNVDFGLGPVGMSVDYTSCSADTTFAGGKDFISAFVDLNGDSITVRHGTLGDLGAPMYKKNGFLGTGTLAPVCAIYKEGNSKYSAFAYAGIGPSSVYYNMELLVTGITPVSNELPSAFRLEQNYPNPFNPETNIKFAVAKTGSVTLKVFDLSGREVALLVNEELTAGTYNFDFNASHLASGIYFYKLVTNGFADTKKMVLVK